jgi:hypothetical protein
MVVDEKGTILDTVDIGEMDLDKPFARAEISDEIQRAVKMALPRGGGE